VPTASIRVDHFLFFDEASGLSLKQQEYLSNGARAVIVEQAYKRKFSAF